MLETMKFKMSGKKLVTLLLRIMDIAAQGLILTFRNEPLRQKVLEGRHHRVLAARQTPQSGAHTPSALAARQTPQSGAHRTADNLIEKFYY